jgi:hypothetical protein
MFNRAFTQAKKPALGPESDGMTTEASLYRKRGKPERAMAEIRREILRKLRVRLKKERLSSQFDERKSAGRTNHIESKSASPLQSDEM